MIINDIIFLIINFFIALIIIYNVHLSEIVKKDKFEFISPLIIFSCFYFIYYVIGASLSIFLPSSFFSQENKNFFPLASGISLIGILFFYIGYKIKINKKIIYKFENQIFSSQIQKSLLFVIISFLITWTIRLYLLNKNIIISKLFLGGNNLITGTNELYLTTLITFDRALWIVNPSIGIFTSLLAYNYYFIHKKNRNLYLIIIIIEVLYQIFILNNRLPALIIILFYIPYKIYYTYNLQIPFKKITIIILLWIFLIYPLGKAMRSNAFNYLKYDFNIENISYFVTNSFDLFIEDYKNFNSFESEKEAYIYYRFAPNDFFSSVLNEINEKGYLWGETYFRESALIIPRFLWPNKPDYNLEAESNIQKRYNLPYYDTMITPITEAYSNFGMPGVILLMFLYGYFSKKYWLFIKKYKNDKLVFLIYIYFLYNFYSPEQSLVGGLFMALRSFISIFVLLFLVDKIIYKPFIKKHSQTLIYNNELSKS